MATPGESGDFCVFIGLLGALAAVLTGYTDFHETFGYERRVATAHGLINTTVTVLYLASWLMRWLGASGIHTTAIVVSIVGYVLVLGGAYLGGDLIFAIGTMVNRNAFAEGPEKEYVEVGQPSDFEEGRMRKVEAGGMPVLVVRYGGRLCATPTPARMPAARSMRASCGATPWSAHGTPLNFGSPTAASRAARRPSINPYSMCARATAG